MAKQKPNPQSDEDDYPFWHVKKQTGYRVHRLLMVIQIVVALFMAWLIWWGMRVLLPSM